MRELSTILSEHKKWLSGEGGQRADLRGADLGGANLDFSALPLWCGSLSANFDDKHIVQIIYHAVKAGTQSANTSPELKAELEGFIDVANRFHRVEECGRIAKEVRSDE